MCLSNGDVARLPTTRSNAEAIALARGYELRIRRTGAIVVLVVSTGQRVHRADRWSEILRWLVAAPRIDSDDPPSAA
jgi:hypothetical protein